MLHITRSAYYYQALRRARWGGSLALEPLQVSASSNRLFTGGDISVVEVTKIWADGKTAP